MTAQIVADTINADRLEKWLAFGTDLEYQRTQETFENIFKNSPELKKLYIFHTNDRRYICDF